MTASSVIELLLARASAGAAVVIVTHSAVVASAATRQIHLRDGRVDERVDERGTLDGATPSASRPWLRR